METRYVKDSHTGFTLRVDESVAANGDITVSVGIANQLVVRDGQVFALPFAPPKSETEKRREVRAALIDRLLAV